MASSSTWLTWTCGVTPALRRTNSRPGDCEARTSLGTGYRGIVDARQAPKPGRRDGRVWRLLRAHRLKTGCSGCAAPRVDRTATTTASSSGVGDPATTRSSGSASLHSSSSPYSGMFPCLRGGRLARLLRRARSARVIIMRDSCGKITRSM